MNGTVEGLVAIGTMLGFLCGTASTLLNAQKKGRGDLEPVTAVPAIIVECWDRYDHVSEGWENKVACRLMDGSYRTFTQVGYAEYKNAKAQTGEPGLLVFRGMRYHHFRTGACSEEEKCAVEALFNRLR